MDFFTQGVDVLKTLVIAIGGGLGAWGVINLMEGYGNDNRATRS
ncbi:TPA: Maff2 family mobile element protein [Streptococcus suis]